MTSPTPPLLFTPLQLRGLTVKNRIVISPMCQYSAVEGLANDWHLVHLGKLASGGAGMVFCEAVAVDRDGRITHGDLGLWSDAHIAPLERITDFQRSQGCVPAIQLAHAGRKASMQRPWFGNGPLDATDLARGDRPWTIVAPSPIPMDDGWLQPHALTREDIELHKLHWREATRRALAAGFDVAEVHGAHGYLLHEFLSPLSTSATTSTAAASRTASGSRWRSLAKSANCGHRTSRCSSACPRWTGSTVAGHSRIRWRSRGACGKSAST